MQLIIPKAIVVCLLETDDWPRPFISYSFGSLRQALAKARVASNCTSSISSSMQDWGVADHAQMLRTKGRARFEGHWDTDWPQRGISARTVTFLGLQGPELEIILARPVTSKHHCRSQQNSHSRIAFKQRPLARRRSLQRTKWL